ncbi:MAG: glycine cleavage system protein H [Candidatus Kryptoniota bacterium]
MVSYKLCDRNHECENCPFDIVMRQDPSIRKSLMSTAKKGDIKNISAISSFSTNDYLQTIVNSFFASILSFPMAYDRLYTHGHLWILQEKPNLLTIGIDHIVSHFLKSMEEIVLPQVHTALSADSPCIWIVCHEGTVTIPSPLEGEVARINSRLIESAHLLNSSPYIDGWMISISTNKPPLLKEKFFDADIAKTLYANEICSIQENILSELSRASPETGQTMFDGGIRAKNLEDVIGTRKYFFLLQNLISKSKK